MTSAAAPARTQVAAQRFLGWDALATSVDQTVHIAGILRGQPGPGGPALLPYFSDAPPTPDQRIGLPMDFARLARTEEMLIIAVAGHLSHGPSAEGYRIAPTQIQLLLRRALG